MLLNKGEALALEIQMHNLIDFHSLTDEVDFIEWINNYHHYLALRLELANLLAHPA